MDKVNVVVGGGIAGIATAYYLRKSGKSVILIEKSAELGGLLRSKEVNGKYFDFGTHILRETGIEELDQFFFEGLDFKRYNHLKYGSYHSSLYEGNGFLTDRSLSEEDAREALQELIQISEEPRAAEPSTLADQLTQEFGQRYAELLLQPVVEKLFSQEAKTLAPNAHHLFGLGRLICGSSQETQRLKDNSHLDSKLAYHSYTEGLGPLKSIYPETGGVGAWIILLEQKLVELGVQISKGNEFKISGTGERIEKLAIGGDGYEIENLYWTVPPIFLFFELGLERPNSKPPQRLSSVVVDLVLEGDYLTDLYYFQVYDPQLSAFRVTCYDNYNPENNPDQNLKRLSVEFLSADQEISTEKFAELAKIELVKMKIVVSEDLLDVVNVDVVKGGFPIPTPEFRAATSALAEALSPIENLNLFGKASGKVWFMPDVLMEIHNHFTAIETDI